MVRGAIGDTPDLHLTGSITRARLRAPGPSGFTRANLNKILDVFAPCGVRAACSRIDTAGAALWRDPKKYGSGIGSSSESDGRE